MSHQGLVKQLRNVAGDGSGYVRIPAKLLLRCIEVIEQNAVASVPEPDPPKPKKERRTTRGKKVSTETESE